MIKPAQGWIVLAVLLIGGSVAFFITLGQRSRTVTSRGTETGNGVAGKTINVGKGENLQKVLNAAESGDTIVLEAGATYVGPFVLPKKNNDAYITIQSSRTEQLPAGQRVTPANQNLMPKLLSPGKGEPAVRTAAGAHHYQLIGVEIAPVADNAFIYDLVAFGEGGETQTSMDLVPHHLILDRCYVHAYPNQSLKRGIALNSASTNIINSYIAGFKVVGQDSQAIAGWNGPGPFQILNNYLEAAGENVIFGGAVPAIPNLIPTDIQIRGNHFYKPMSWRVGDPTYSGTRWAVKNLFELKTGRKVIVDANLFENNWADAQSGFAILFNCIDDSGSWARIEDVQFSNNVVRHSGNGFNLRGLDNGGASAARITIRNNLFDDISIRLGGTGILFQLLRGTPDVVIEHNTGFNEGSVLVLDFEPHKKLVFRNNIARHNAYGVFGAGGYIGTAALEHFAEDWIFRSNILIGLPGDVSGAQYPPNNYFPASTDQIAFVDARSGDYRLAQNSRFKGKATDGTDIGCDPKLLPTQ